MVQRLMVANGNSQNEVLNCYELSLIKLVLCRYSSPESAMCFFFTLCMYVCIDR